MKPLMIKELIDFMNKNGISRTELADILGVTHQAVSLWLTGKRDISITITRLIKIMQKYPQLIREFKNGDCHE